MFTNCIKVMSSNLKFMYPLFHYEHIVHVNIHLAFLKLKLGGTSNAWLKQ